MMLDCFIIDDEPSSLELLERMVKRTGGLRFIGAERDAISACKQIMNMEVNPHLVFLGINMPGMPGIAIGRELPEQIRIIYVTGHPEFALSAFETNALDYILKPVYYARFLQAVRKATGYFNAVELKIQQCLWITYQRKQLRIPFDEILYIESQNKKVLVHVLNGKPYEIHSPLKEIERKLPAALFPRVHQSFIINRNMIHSMDSSMIWLNNKKGIPVTNDHCRKILKMKS